MERRRFFFFVVAPAPVLLTLSAALTSAWWLPAMGNSLVEDDLPAKSDIGVVLGGDGRGDRIEKSAQLIRAGYIPRALISGPAGFYGSHESDLAIPFIVRQGYPAVDFLAVPNNALSTREEARVMLAEMRRLDVRSFLLITSDYHTRRAGRTYRFVGRTMGYLPAMRVVGAPDRLFRIDQWWKTREGQKAVFFEWAKTLAFAAGL